MAQNINNKNILLLAINKLAPTISDCEHVIFTEKDITEEQSRDYISLLTRVEETIKKTQKDTMQLEGKI